MIIKAFATALTFDLLQINITNVNVLQYVYIVSYEPEHAFILKEIVLWYLHSLPLPYM